MSRYVDVALQLQVSNVGGVQKACFFSLGLMLESGLMYALGSGMCL